MFKLLVLLLVGECGFFSLCFFIKGYTSKGFTYFYYGITVIITYFMVRLLWSIFDLIGLKRKYKITFARAISIYFERRKKVLAFPVIHEIGHLLIAEIEYTGCVNLLYLNAISGFVNCYFNRFTGYRGLLKNTRVYLAGLVAAYYFGTETDYYFNKKHFWFDVGPGTDADFLEGFLVLIVNRGYLGNVYYSDLSDEERYLWYVEIIEPQFNLVVRNLRRRQADIERLKDRVRKQKGSEIRIMGNEIRGLFR